LYAGFARDDFISFTQLLLATFDAIPEHFPDNESDVHAAVANLTTRAMVSRLTQHGAFEVSGTEQHLGPEQIMTDPDLRVRLTDLGRYALREQLLADGTTAPLRAELH
jgi:hypothetical protein